MQHGCCSWCLKIVKAPDDYDRRQHRLFCSPQCYWIDWMFRQWQSDDNLNRVAKEFMEDRDGKTKDG